MKENYQKLKDIIQKTNPYNTWTEGCSCGNDWPRPVRLADVLLALKVRESEHNKKLDEQYKNLTGYSPTQPLECPLFYQAMMAITSYELDGNSFWKFDDDNLDNQSDETKQFLIDLLVTR